MINYENVRMSEKLSNVIDKNAIYLYCAHACFIVFTFPMYVAQLLCGYLQNYLKWFELFVKCNVWPTQCLVFRF